MTRPTIVEQKEAEFDAGLRAGLTKAAEIARTQKDKALTALKLPSVSPSFERGRMYASEEIERVILSKEPQ